MADYTTDEIQAAVERLVRSSIRRPYDTLGVRRVDVSFSDIQEAAAGTFILNESSPFYVLSLGARRLGELIVSEAEVVDKLLDAMKCCDRKVLPVEDVSSLFNAKAALQELGGAAAQREQGFVDITKVPAYQRFAENVQAFLTSAGNNIKSKGSIASTPQEARILIPQLVTELKETHELLVERVKSLSEGLENYNNVNLPSLVAAGVISRASAVIGEDADKLEALSPTARLSLVRDTVLNLLASKAVVTTLGSFQPVGSFYDVKGQGFAFSDASRPAVPAHFESDFGGAKAILQGVSDALTLTVDGGSPFTLTLNPSLVGVLEGQAAESEYGQDKGFLIGDGVTPAAETNPFFVGNIANNWRCLIQSKDVSFMLSAPLSGNALGATHKGNVDVNALTYPGGVTGFTITIVAYGTSTSHTVGAPANAAAFLAALNSAFTGKAQFAIDGSGFLSVTDLLGKGYNTSSITISGTLLAIVGMTPGTYKGRTQLTTLEDICTAFNATIAPLSANVKLVAEPYFSPLRFSGLIDITAGTNTTWTLVGGFGDLVAQGVIVGDMVYVKSGANQGWYTITARTSTTITVTGTFVLQTSAEIEIGSRLRKLRLRHTPASATVPTEHDLGWQVPTTANEQQAFLATFGFTPTAVYNGSSFNYNPLGSRLSKLKAVADDINQKTTKVVASTVLKTISPTLEGLSARADTTDFNKVVFYRLTGTGNTSFVTTTLTLTLPQAFASPPLVGEIVALRSGTTLKSYTITAVSADGLTITATGSFAGTADTNVTFEIGPSISVTKYDVVRILTGPNQGDYYAHKQGDNGLEVILWEETLPVRVVNGRAVVFTASYLREYLVLDSLNTTTASAITVNGTAAALFWSTTPKTKTGTSEWFKLPQWARGLAQGDYLELYASQYNAPSASHLITVTDKAGLVIGISPVTPCGVTWNFGAELLPPFARLRVGTKFDFDGFKNQCDEWLNRASSKSSFWTEFNRLLNPLLVSENPTATQVGDAVNHLKSLFGTLTTVEAEVQNLEGEDIQSILASYQVEAVPAVDTLLRTYQEKGADRATDLLLEGKFESFFSVSQDGASYAGAMQEALRDVARNDLAIRKTNRRPKRSTLVSQTESPDFEYTRDSVNESVTVDPPTGNIIG